MLEDAPLTKCWDRQKVTVKVFVKVTSFPVKVNLPYLSNPIQKKKKPVPMIPPVQSLLFFGTNMLRLSLKMDPALLRMLSFESIETNRSS